MIPNGCSEFAVSTSVSSEVKRENIVFLSGNKTHSPSSTTPPYFPHRVNRFGQ
jgi:hypothetical protein